MNFTELGNLEIRRSQNSHPIFVFIKTQVSISHTDDYVIAVAVSRISLLSALSNLKTLTNFFPR